MAGYYAGMAVRGINVKERWLDDIAVGRSVGRSAGRGGRRRNFKDFQQRRLLKGGRPNDANDNSHKVTFISYQVVLYQCLSPAFMKD